MQYAAGASQKRRETRVHVKIIRGRWCSDRAARHSNDVHKEALSMAGPGGGGTPRQ